VPKDADRILENLSSAKTGRIDNKVISPKSSKNFCIVEQILKIVYLKIDSRSL
jgi:hypothetical protein